MARHIALALTLALTLAAVCLRAQGAGYVPGNAISVVTAVPLTCNVGETAIVTTTTVTSSMGTYFCTQPNIWQRMSYARLKNFVGLQNNVFIDILTVTIPNNNVSALIQVDLLGALGAGGAVGPNESSTGRTAYIAITRVQNVAADSTVTIAVNAADAKVLGGAGITLGTQMSAITGAANAVQTATLQARITRGGGTSNNHELSIRAQIIRGANGGVNIS